MPRGSKVEPFPRVPELRDGQELAKLARSIIGEDIIAAAKRAAKMPWWSRRASDVAYATTRYWMWVLNP